MRKRYLSLLFATLLMCSLTATFGTPQAKTVEFELVSQFKLIEPKVNLYITNQEIKQIKLQKELEIEKQKKIAEENERVRLEQIRIDKTYCDFVLTYYALLSQECGNTLGVTASGKQVQEGMVASPKALSFGTKILIEGNEYTVEDRGSSKYIKVNNDGSIRLDVFIGRLNGESDSQYSKRVNDMGVKRVKGYIVNK